MELVIDKNMTADELLIQRFDAIGTLYDLHCRGHRLDPETRLINVPGTEITDALTVFTLLKPESTDPSARVLFIDTEEVQEAQCRDKRLKLELTAATDVLYAHGITVTPFQPLGPVSKKIFWQIRLLGPNGTPYAGGIFYLCMSFGPNYPFGGLAFNFTTRIMHPNVGEDGTVSGIVSPGHTSSPLWGADKVLFALIALLNKPLLSHCHPTSLANPWSADLAARYTAVFAVENRACRLPLPHGHLALYGWRLRNMVRTVLKASAYRRNSSRRGFHSLPKPVVLHLLEFLMPLPNVPPSELM